MRRDLISEVIHTLSFKILKEGGKAAELNVEVKELFEALDQFNVGLTVIPQLIWIFIDLLQVLQNLVGSMIGIGD